eukprot:scaffold88597_cov40-Phaeocystis_antarctica.AAC.2
MPTRPQRWWGTRARRRSAVIRASGWWRAAGVQSGRVKTVKPGAPAASVQLLPGLGQIWQSGPSSATTSPSSLVSTRGRMAAK